MNVIKRRQYSITFFSVNFTKKGEINLKKIENSWVSSQQMFTDNLGMTDIDIHLERTVGQFTERTEIFK